MRAGSTDTFVAHRNLLFGVASELLGPAAGLCCVRDPAEPGHVESGAPLTRGRRSRRG
ncbi:hypothetical protein [Actinomadura sediminis]|uniref:Uncharacterized protein n=1 Tax=Actinomadura sediminis TaxID=1038904 RepID=A0ABW3END4_9ACTN